MSHTFFLFKIYTDLKQIIQLPIRDSIQLIYDENLAKSMTDNLPSVNDLLITTYLQLEKYTYFPGSIILFDADLHAGQGMNMSDQVLVFSPRGFNESVLQYVEMKHKVLKSHREKSSMMNQLDLTIREYNDLQAKLSEQDKNIEKRLAMLNHELKTPLNIIQGHVGLLKSTVLNQQQLDYLSRIEKSAMFLNEAFSEILYYEDMLKNQLTSESLPFEIEMALEDIHQVYKSFAEEKGLGYEVFYDSRIYPQFIGDLMKLQLLIKQLISNALKFTTKGHIVFSVRCIEEMPKHQKLEFVVEDTGIGFDTNKFEAFFEPFKQGEHYLKRHYNGLGLGLTIVQNVVNALQGTIDVWSSEGAGSRFVVTVTLEKDPSLDGKALEKPCVLVVDDNVLNRKILKEMLVETGFAVELARNGKEAVELLYEDLPKVDLVLMDLIMPVMDGFEATKLIRQFNASVPIIVLSASISEADIKRIEGFKIDDFMVKDHNLTQYLKVIGKYLVIPEGMTEAPVPDEKIGEVKRLKFEIIDIDSFLLRFNYNLSLIHKLCEGIMQQTESFSSNWEKLKVDPHDETVMRYLHSLKGLLRSVDDNTLADLIETVEKSMDSSLLSTSTYTNIDQRMMLLRKDLSQILQWTASHTLDEDDEDALETVHEDVKAILETMLTDLKLHDVKQIRLKSARIKDAKLDVSCMEYLKPFFNLINSYQYDQASEWLRNAFEQWGDRSCLT